MIFSKKKEGINVILTRNTDVFIPLSERAKIANEANADVFLSIHANAAPTSDLHGIETYSMDTASDASASKLARRENALAIQTDGKKHALLGQLMSVGTERASKELAIRIQHEVVQKLGSVVW